MTRLPAIEAHRIWAASYDSAPNPLLALERRSLHHVLASRPLGTVVDIGCGTGDEMERLQQRGAIVVGLDACEAMLERAKSRPLLSGRLVQANAQRLPIASASADVVVCSMSLGYFEDLNAIFREFSRIVRPNGSIVVTDLHPDAVAAGWTRSFKAEGRHIEIEHSNHSPGVIKAAAFSAGLRLAEWTNARLGPSELPLFERVGKAHLFIEIAKIPALFLSVWEPLC